MIALLLAILPTDATVTDRCDEIEFNRFYDDCGRPVFEQVIFWESANGVRVVREWRMNRSGHDGKAGRWYSDKGYRVTRVPGGWRLTFMDGDVLREITTHAPPRVTWTQDDVELLNRDVLPKELRVPFGRVSR